MPSSFVTTSTLSLAFSVASPIENIVVQTQQMTKKFNTFSIIRSPMGNFHYLYSNYNLKVVQHKHIMSH
uniref:Putative secreted protein n=1 Tax=Lutzomyia longipalpis TaxID=7200 RepID=A0A7G3AG52_LUTLO